ncbi:hypothetical protein COCON_G00150600 [Conger conger]|uniref:Uncharacterized protein n=1 Tax=Conger conger TaxID=82655 RepID=A0A9Q1DCJ2_CONCO|nr:hypothetical protein COCON_G00150600 [Conger conger]
MMATPECFVAAARQFLTSGKKKFLSVSLCLNLAVQVLAVDSGLKPAMVYDTNSAGPDQVQRYLDKLRALGLVTDALRIVTIDDNVLIINLDLIVQHLEELLLKKNVAVIDVSKSRDQPALASMEYSGIEEPIQGILCTLRTLPRDSLVVPAVGQQLCVGWNLCSVFGILLGFPATYWFQQKSSFENCLTMVPLVVTKATASWDTVAGGYSNTFSSFSVPQLLIPETRPLLDKWTEKLQERFGQQSVFSALTVSTEMVCLPSVSL